MSEARFCDDLGFFDIPWQIGTDFLMLEAPQVSMVQVSPRPIMP